MTLALPLRLEGADILDANGNIVASVYGIGEGAEIIAAVNSQAELIEAAKEVISMAATRDVRSFVWGSVKLENLRAAIAAAEAAK